MSWGFQIGADGHAALGMVVYLPRVTILITVLAINLVGEE